MEKQQQGRAIETTVTTTTIYDNEEEEQTTLRDVISVAFESCFILSCGAMMFLIASAASKKPKPEKDREA